MDIPSSMKALVLRQHGEIAVEEVLVPELEDGDVLLRVMAATTCGTDLKAYRRGHPQIPMPGPFGHEYSGVVVASRSSKFAVGDAVMGVHSAPCQSCFWCLREQENLCESIMASKVLGSYAEFLRVPARIVNLNVYPKPAYLPFAEASLLEPLACVAEGVRVLGLAGVQSALILGAGPISLMFVAVLRLQGVKSIVVAARNKDKLSKASDYGAAISTIDELDILASGFPGGGFDVVIECTGAVEVWERSISWVRRGGEILLFGGPPGGTTATFSTHRLHYDQITLKSPFHFGTAAVRLAYDWLASGKLGLGGLITGKRKLEDGPQVFADLDAGKGLKFAFTPGAS